MSELPRLQSPAQRGDLVLSRQPLPEMSGGFDDLPQPLPLVAGGLLGALALKRRDLSGILLGGLGAGLLYGGARANGLLDGGWLRRLLKTRNRHLVSLEYQMIVDRAPDEVYQFWRNPELTAVYLPRIRDVQTVNSTTTWWQLKLTDALRVEWTAELIEDQPGELLVWRTRAPSDLYQEGWIAFEPRRDGQSTLLRFKLSTLAPAGRLGAALMEWLEELPVRYLSEDMERFRSVIENRSSRTEAS